MTEKNESALPAALQIAGEVKESVEAYKGVRDDVVKKLVTAEIENRVQKLTDALSARKTLFVELKKAEKPDVQTFNADGSVATSGYSKEKLEQIKKAKEKLDKQDKAIEAALGGDFSKLQEAS